MTYPLPPTFINDTTQGGMGAVSAQNLNDYTTAITDIDRRISGMVTSVAARTGAVTLVRADVGLGNVDNTPDFTKPTSVSTLLDRWRSARNASATQLVEVIMMGDSTFHGQTATGDNAGSENNHPISQKLRALAIAAGYTDGGCGVRGFNGGASMSGADSIVHVQSNTGFQANAYGAAGNNGLMHNNSIKTSASTGNSGSTITLQGKGTQVRIAFAYPTAAAANFTYQVNALGAVTVTAPTGLTTSKIKTYVVSGLPGAGATNTVTVTLITAGIVEFTVEWLNATGIVFQNYAQPGQSVARRWDFTGTQVDRFISACQLGLFEDIQWPNGTTLDAFDGAPGGVRSPALAILNLGINDLAQISGTTDALLKAQNLRGGVGLFAETCRAAAVDAIVCVPHLLYSSSSSSAARAYIGEIKTALMSAARAWGLPVVDLQTPLGTDAQSISTWGNSRPHPNAAAYDAQASYLWTNLLSR